MAGEVPSSLPGRMGRSRTVRAAALVTVGLAATACGDDAPPPDAPMDTAQRQEACEAAHRRLGADPANCAVLERVAQREHAAARPHFSLRANCEAAFGRGACEGDTSPLPRGALWRPALAGWVLDPGPYPVIRDRQGQAWELSNAGQPPRAVADDTVRPEPEDMTPGQRMSYARHTPTYPSQQDCEQGWDRCEATMLPNRFVDERLCDAVWTSCTEIVLPAQEPSQTNVADNQGTGSSHGRTGYVGSHFWWYGYNSGWSRAYAGSYAPRYQGWGWTGDRAPTAVYRPSTGTPQAWNSGTRSLTPARSLASIAGAQGSTTLSTQTTTISRAGFGSTGRSYSAGG